MLADRDSAQGPVCGDHGPDQILPGDVAPLAGIAGGRPVVAEQNVSALGDLRWRDRDVVPAVRLDVGLGQLLSVDEDEPALLSPAFARQDNDALDEDLAEERIARERPSRRNPKRDEVSALGVAESVDHLGDKDTVSVLSLAAELGMRYSFEVSRIKTIRPAARTKSTTSGLINRRIDQRNPMRFGGQ